MLLELRVNDLGIIEKISWSPGPGLNVITGETGAGKSLVIDAVEALLAGKVDEEVIRHGANETQIEGVFALPQGRIASGLKELLEESGLKADDETLAISCELRRQGRSVVRVNGRAVSKTIVNQIGHLLIDIHGQSEHLSLIDTKYHLDFLDSYAHAMDLRNSFNNRAAELTRVEQELKALAQEEKDMARREEFLRFQLDEIKKANLHDGEEEDLERDRIVLASAEKLKALSYDAYQAIYKGDTQSTFAPAIDKLNEAVDSVRKLTELDPTLKPQLSLLQDTVYSLEEAASEILSYSERLEHDPQRLEEIELRLELIRNLKRKYGQTIADVIIHMQKAETELDSLSHSFERRAELDHTRSKFKEEMGQIASKLSQARSQASRKLVAETKKELQDLNMAQVEFDISLAQAKAPDGIPLPDGDTYAFTNEGIDSVEFIASTNPGEPLKPLNKIASTGEISRFTLALKGALSEVDSTPVLIFDEIDMGVGGRSGEVIGKKLWALARNHQVICVTHLPQIAAFADFHYNVHKSSTGTRTTSTLYILEGESRLKELAVMLAGPQYTQTSLNDARELQQKATTWKQTHRQTSKK